jgi:MFS family permease
VLTTRGGKIASPEAQPGHGEVSDPGLGAQTVTDLLNEAPASKFHRRTVIISGVGFFTDAYDLFVIGTAATLVALEWHLSTLQTSWVTGAAILGAFVGAFTFGRIADVIGRKKVYVTVAVIMIFGAVASAFAPDFIFLVIARLVLGLGIGGDYPVSAVFMSEYSNRQDRGRLVGLVFSMQALGLIVGPLIALLLLSSGIGDGLSWRILLGLGAVPAAAVVYLRSKMPESPRYLAQVQGESARAATDLKRFSDGVITQPTGAAIVSGRLQLRQFLSDPRMLKLILGTAGAWFLFDYAYYGNTLSLPAILKEVNPTASLETKLLWSLGMFVIFAVPGYLLAIAKMDRNRPSAIAIRRVLCHGLVFRGVGHRPGTHATRSAVLGHPRFELLLHSVRSEHDDVRVALRSVPGEHANHWPRHGSGNRQVGRVRRRVLGARSPRPHRFTWALGRGGCVGSARVRRDYPAPGTSRQVVGGCVGGRHCTCSNRPGGRRPKPLRFGVQERIGSPESAAPTQRPGNSVGICRHPTQT